MLNLLFIALLMPMSLASKNGTERPIIGILAQETSDVIRKHFPDGKSYISAAYVKAIESSGARVVPIFVNQTQEEYDHILKSINGLVLPGGNTYFTNPKGYAEAGEILYKTIKIMNDKGDYFPILGICLGFELLLYLDNEKIEFRTSCQSKNEQLSLKFVEDYQKSKLYQNLSNYLSEVLQNEPVTYNQHIYCITKSIMKERFDSIWKLLSTSFDDLENEFVSSAESLRYPIAGLQFHPEKNPYEWRPDLKIPHSKNAIECTRYFFDWIVSEAKKNSHSFSNLKEEKEKLISNYPVTFTKGKLIYDNIYFFV